MLWTPRLTLHDLHERHRDHFADLHADPVVMADQGGPIDRLQSDAKFDRYRKALALTGVSRWAIEGEEGRFLGYAGVMFRPETDHPLGPHHEVGWRLARHAWGYGYASEAARVALRDAFRVREIEEILSYTSPDNHRSQAVMGRLGLARDPSRDFVAKYDGTGEWRGLVWVACNPG